MLLIRILKLFLSVSVFFLSTFFVSVYVYKPSAVPLEQWRRDYSREATDAADNIFWFVQVSTSQHASAALPSAQQCGFYFRSFSSFFCGSAFSF